MKLILTRHGETEANTEHIIQSHLPGKLSAEGETQAEKLAQRLKDEKIDIIFSSDLKRAADTAKIVAKYHPEAELVFTEELREGNAGDFTGKRSDEVDWSKRPANAETLEQIRDRVTKLLKKVYESHSHQNVLFVGHNGVNKSIIGYIMNKPVNDMVRADNQKNTAVNIFEVKENGNHKVCLINCAKHLD
jgi:broad specificity phosphatase PhoE